MIEHTEAISTERALKLALEALECTEYPQDHYDAITALREALALVNKVDQEQPAQPQQEPVAYIHRQGNHYEVSERFLSDDEKSRGWTEESLYTSPPTLSLAQRKPLTDEEIKTSWPNTRFDFSEGVEDVLMFARAIESAHGIKENT